jgi:SAM-dependent methyltransferase
LKSARPRARGERLDGFAPGHADPYRAIDQQTDPDGYVTFLETRGGTPSQVRLRQRFLRFCSIEAGWQVLEVGTGTGVLARDLAHLVGSRGRVVALDPSRVFISAARRLAREYGLDGRIDFRVGNGAALRFPANRFDCAVAVTVLLHVANAGAIVSELARVTRPGGVVGIQDQDLGSLVLDHPDRALTRRILDGVAARTIVDPWSGRALVGRLVTAGLTRVRLTTDVFQDTTFTPFSRSMLERRAENAARFGLASSRAAKRWFATIERLAGEGRFVMTLNFYGAAGTKPLRTGGGR